MSNDAEFEDLKAYLARVPAVDEAIGVGRTGPDRWWVKFIIDIEHPLAWNVVQEFGHVLNYVSLDERLPTAFMPVSPPPYMNGGPKDYLSWVIECSSPVFTPADCAEWLEGRLPRPVEDLAQWEMDSSEFLGPS